MELRARDRPAESVVRVSDAPKAVGLAVKLLGPAEIRDLAELLGIQPTKKLGQNFVIDANTVRRIVRISGVTAGMTAVEIGPGLGSLTLGLLETGAESSRSRSMGASRLSCPTRSTSGPDAPGHG